MHKKRRGVYGRSTLGRGAGTETGYAVYVCVYGAKRAAAKKCHSAKIWWRKTPTKTQAEQEEQEQENGVRHKECPLPALTKANTWHLALFDVVSGHVGATLRCVVLCCSTGDPGRQRGGAAGQPFLQVSRRPRRLANYAHGGKYSGRLRHAAPRAATTATPQRSLSALPLRLLHACPFSGCRLNLLPSGISFVAGEVGSGAGLGGCSCSALGANISEM